jgi:predicted alpha-1,6-mannanase (GH76 family)
VTASNGWAARAASVERGVLRRHLRGVWGVPGTALGVVAWPATTGERLFGHWHYWWQAHLLDCLVDAERRDPDPERRRWIRRLLRGIRLRNGGRWHNDYYDDMAWLGLALLRASVVMNRAADWAAATAAASALSARIAQGWAEDPGGLPWRRDDEYRNAPANGPAAILLAHTGNPLLAERIVDWIHTRLELPGGLIADGWRPDVVDATVYSYGQGVVLGAELELVRRLDRSPAGLHALAAAVSGRLAPNGVLAGHGGGNGGLFSGILARYLAQVVVRLPGTDATARLTRERCAVLVLESAAAAWRGRLETPDGPLLAAEWARPAGSPDRGGAGRVRGNALVESSVTPERDLSVQLSGWMLLEAAALVSRGG